MQSELDLQREVSQQFSHNADIVRAEFNKDLDALNEKIKTEKDPEKQKEYEQQRDKLQQRQVFFNMVVAALSAPTDSAAGIAAATAAPAISYGIGQEFKNNKLKNEKDGGNRPTEGSATHIASHMALGAVVSALGGNDAVSGALAAGGAEALVPLFSKAMYGTTDPEKLTAADKQNLSNMARLFGAAVGAATGNGTANGYADVAQGGMNAGNAVENNFGVIPLPAPSPVLPFHNSSSGMTREEQLLLGRTSTDANEEAARELSKAASKAGRLIKATDGVVVGTVICLFDSRCPSVSEASQSIWDDAMGNQNSGSSTDAEQKLTQGTAQSNRQSQAAAGAPMPPDPDDEGNEKRGEKGKTFRGGSKKQRDNWYGYNDRKFQNWWHREGKRDWGKDIDNAAEAKAAWDEWNALGKPNPK